MVHEWLSRRQFLLGMGAAGLTAATWRLGTFLEQFNFGDTDLSFLEHLHPPLHPLPSKFTGLTINAPFAWENDDAFISQVFDAASVYGADTIRLYIDDKYEYTLGIYEPTVLDKVAAFAQKLDIYNQAHKTHTGLLISLFDTYGLLHADKPNIDYGSHPLTSPYFRSAPGVIKESKQQAFFTDPTMRERFKTRIGTILEALHPLGNIVAGWEIANEPEIPGLLPDTAQDVLTNWYTDIISFIRQHDPNRPLVTGLAAPWLIDETRLTGQNIVNSFHVYAQYFHQINPVFAYLRNFALHSQLPLAGLEVGVSNGLMGPQRLPAFSTRLLHLFTDNNTLYVTNLSPWKMGNWQDNFDASPIHPQLAPFFSEFSQRLKTICAA